jgi:hypothetical protein
MHITAMIFWLTTLLLVFILSILILAKAWSSFKDFHHKNDTFMDLIFILLYSLEQFIFLYLYYSNTGNKELLVALIVLIVTTTAALDKLMMYSRHKYLQEVLNLNIIEKNDLLNTIQNQDEQIKNRDEEIRTMDRIISNLQ